VDSPTDRMRALVAEARRQPAINPPEGLDSEGPVRSVPGWVARLHVLPAGPREWWLLCEPAPGRADLASGQFVFAAAAGRYMVDTHDPATGDCVARESAEGGPIVAGLACTGPAVLVHIYPVGSHPASPHFARADP
jgi:hypothetical protein